MRYRPMSILIISILLYMPAGAQFFIDSPSPTSLFQGDYNISLRLGPEGTMIARLSSVPFSGVSIGVSYGGEKILGYEDPLFYPNVGVEFRVMVLEGSEVLPHIIIGYDSQGYDWDGDVFRVFSKGFYSLCGKEMGLLKGGAGINYNTAEEMMGFFGGVIVNLSQTFAIVGDYSLYPEADESQFLALGLRTYFEGILIQFSFRDITGESMGRAIDLGYSGYF